jgi:outer membrane protein, adhesin transport system
MKKNICRRISAWKIIVIIFCWANDSIAQTVNLYDAVNNAVINYPLLQQRQAEVAAGRAHITTVNGNRLPSLVLQDQGTKGSDNSLQGAYFSLGMVPSTPGSYTTVHNNPNTGNVALSFLKWEFYTFGYYNAQQKEAKSQLAVSEANLAGDKYLLSENIISLYLDWLKKYRLLQIQNENMQRAQVVLSAIRATVLSGLKPGVDSSTASAVYSDARINYLQALDNYNYDKIALGTYTSINIDNAMPDTSIISPALLQNTAAVPLSENVSPEHPLVEIYQKQYEQQLANSNTISKKYLPRLGLDGAAWVRNSGISPTGVYPESLADGMPYSRSNYLFGLTLTYNLFDLKHRHDELSESRYLADAKKDALQTQQLSLNAMMQQANSTYSTTLEKLKELPVELAAQRQAYGQQMALYRSGLNTLLDVTNAQYMLLQAETNYVITQDALLQLAFIRAGLAGQLDNFLQNFKK